MTDIKLDELIKLQELVKMRKEKPEEYKELMEGLGEVLMDLVKMTKKLAKKWEDD